MCLIASLFYVCLLSPFIVCSAEVAFDHSHFHGCFGSQSMCLLQVGRRIESVVLPLELLQQLKLSDFTDEQKDIICESIEFRCSDNDFRKITDTIYLDKSLESLAISIISKSNNLYKISIDNLDYNEEFKNKFKQLIKP